MSAELLDTLSNNDEAQGLYEYFQVCLSCFWPLQTAACLAYGAGRIPWCVWYWNSFEAGNGVCKLTSSLAYLHTEEACLELGSAKGPRQLANNTCLGMPSFGHTVLGTDFRFNETEKRLLFPDHTVFEINSFKRYFSGWKKKNPSQKPSLQLTLTFWHKYVQTDIFYILLHSYPYYRTGKARGMLCS